MYQFFLDIYLWIEELSFSAWMRESSSLFAFPGFLYLHTLGMAILAGSATVISLGLLGVWPKSASVKPLEHFYPLLWLGLGIETVTGIGMFMKDATSYGRNPDFYVKLLFVVVGIALLLATRKRVLQNPQLDGGGVPRQARVMAWGSLVCWFMVIVLGRLIAYTNPIPGFFF